MAASPPALPCICAVSPERKSCAREELAVIALPMVSVWKVMRRSWKVEISASPTEPPRLRPALNRPDASPASSGGTEEMAAWFNDIIANARPQPCNNWPATKCMPTVSAVSDRLAKQAAAKQISPAITRMRTSTTSSSLGIIGISSTVGRPDSSST